MSSHPSRLLITCILLSAALGYYFFAVLVRNSRHAMATRQLASGYGYGNDLYPIWLTSRELLGNRTNPYTPAMEHRIETGLYGRPLDRQNPADATINYRGFSYPLYTDMLAAPLALLPFRSLQLVASVLLPLIVGTGVFRWCAALGVSLSYLARACLLLVVLCSCQVLEGIYALQPTLIVATLFAMVAAALRQDRLVSAGVLLALASIKPHLIVLPLLWLVFWTLSDWARRKRFLFAFVLAMSVLIVLSQLWLPGWWRDWLHNLLGYRQYTLPAVAPLVLGKMVGWILALAALGLALAAALRWRRAPADSSSFFLLYAFLLAMTAIFISSSTAVYDHVLLLPAAVWIWFNRTIILRESRPVRLITLLTALAFLWQWFFGPLVTVASFFVKLGRYPHLVVLPVITTASFPLGVLVLLMFLMAREFRRARAPAAVTRES